MAGKKVRVVVLLLVILSALALFALYRGGMVSLTRGKVEISTHTPPPAAPLVKAAQKASSKGEGSRAINSAGDINYRTDAAKEAAPAPLPTHITQEAKAEGKQTEAMNAAGDINIR